MWMKFTVFSLALANLQYEAHYYCIEHENCQGHETMRASFFTRSLVFCRQRLTDVHMTVHFTQQQSHIASIK